MHRDERVDPDLPELAPAEVRLLWVNDWYDEPIEAVVEHRGARCVLRLEDPTALDGSRPLRWLLYPLSEAQRAEHERWHEQYVRHVGAHWCFHDEAHPSEEARAVAPDPEGFFAAHRNEAPVPLEALVPVAWMRSLPVR